MHLYLTQESLYAFFVQLPYNDTMNYLYAMKLTHIKIMENYLH